MNPILAAVVATNVAICAVIAVAVWATGSLWPLLGLVLLRTVEVKK
jgi:hypothetical protein